MKNVSCSDISLWNSFAKYVNAILREIQDCFLIKLYATVFWDSKIKAVKCICITHVHQEVSQQNTAIHQNKEIITYRSAVPQNQSYLTTVRQMRKLLWKWLLLRVLSVEFERLCASWSSHTFCNDAILCIENIANPINPNTYQYTMNSYRNIDQKHSSTYEGCIQ